MTGFIFALHIGENELLAMQLSFAFPVSHGNLD